MTVRGAPVLKTLTFFLLDMNGGTTPEGSEIRLWGVDNEGRDVLIVDRSFKPYFYAIPRDGFSAETLSETLSS